MTQKRLNHLLTLHIYKEMTDDISEDKITKLFINNKSEEVRTSFFATGKSG